MHECPALDSSWPTAVPDGYSSANFTFITTCTRKKPLRDEMFLRDDRCAAVLPGVLVLDPLASYIALSLYARSQRPNPRLRSFPVFLSLGARSQPSIRSLVPSHTDFTHSQADLAVKYARSHPRTQVQTSWPLGARSGSPQYTTQNLHHGALAPTHPMWLPLAQSLCMYTGLHNTNGNRWTPQPNCSCNVREPVLRIF